MANKIDTIYCDLDGVLVDFRGGCKELNAINGYNVDWEKVHDAGIDFWANLNWTKEGERFYKWLEKFCDEEGIDLCILSQVSYNDGVFGKLEWIRNNMPKMPNKNIYFVKKGHPSLDNSYFGEYIIISILFFMFCNDWNTKK